MGDNSLIGRIKSYVVFDLTHIDRELISTYYEFFCNKLKSLVYRQPDLSSEILFWKRLYHQHVIEDGRPPFSSRGKKTKESICFSIRHLNVGWCQGSLGVREEMRCQYLYLL